MNTYFSSDYHFGHANVIKYDGRPYKNVHEMDEAIIANHNSIVGVDDGFFFLGDFSFNDKKTEEYLQRLNGTKFFIKGNHDNHKTTQLYKKYGEYLGGLAEATIEGQKIVLCHYAMRVWNRSHKGAWHLYGHSHQSLPDDPDSLSFDVGCNGWEYKPLSFNQIKHTMSKKTWKPKDHHGNRDFDKAPA